MKNKLIILILLLPIVLMFSLFSVAQATSLVIDTPISSIETKIYDGLVYSSSFVYDLSDENTKNIYLVPYVYPISVKNENKNITFEFSNVDNKDETDPNTKVNLKSINIVIDGIDTQVYLIECLDIASIFITLKCQTYSSQVRLDIISSLPIGISNISVLDINHVKVNVNEIMTGDFLYFSASSYPIGSNADITYYSNNESLLTINQDTGYAKCISSGVVTITSRLNNGIRGVVEKNIQITINKSETITDILVEGKENNVISILYGSETVQFSGEVSLESPNINKANPIIVKYSPYYS
jgi:hypothetical protein